MSALLSLNPIPLISWKGRTFNQVHSSIQKNGQYTENSSNSVQNLFSANPLKIYRREVVEITFNSELFVLFLTHTCLSLSCLVRFCLSRR